ncbi:TPR end-of-group domain-containing protein [Flavivirga spongiicola]|uniref:Phospholipase/carboxylesterase/thioesterase domain-containing protein n=1 Tax=Flavivirga spongiicola TaxID=421621 RepID=A0ABU7XPB2_9FLAO|nr:hypothetical protein [Flavivirga sp. MEBiC05379]MDO5977607.1 hypothetical protein [Flavivirga sp. MEBiC05379]
MPKFFVLIFIFSFGSLIGQNNDFETQKIIDSIKVKNTGDTFALYLPTEFNKLESSAIVFIFEPAARGKVGIQPFIEAAEKHNYILICSNNCRNGPFDENLKRIDDLFVTVFGIFNINQDQIYTAGFSGGSRLATAVAVLTKQIQGIIGCGAGFPSNRSRVPTIDTFSYAGLVGDEDMNYQEMFTVKDWYSKFNIDNELFTYSGNHSWPPSNQILKAFDWLELQAYKKGIKSTDNLFVKEAFDSNYISAKLLENNNQIELAVWEYERIIRNYSRHFKLDSLVLKTKTLKKSKKYKSDTKKREAIKRLEIKIRNTFKSKFDFEFGNTKSNYRWWKKEFDNFRNKYLLSEDDDLKKMGERINYAIFALAYETGQNQLRINNIEKALYCHKLNTVLFPDRSFVFLRLALDYALLDNEEEVLVNLKKAIDKGFNNKDYILNAPELSKYIGKEAFKKVLDSI